MPRRGSQENEPLSESAVISESAVTSEPAKTRIDRATFISEVSEKLQVVEDAIGEHHIFIAKFNSFADRVKTYSDLGDWRINFFCNERNIVVKVQHKRCGFDVTKVQPNQAEDENDYLPKYFDINGPLVGPGAIFVPDELAAQLALAGDDVQYSVEDLLKLGGQIVQTDFVLPDDYQPISAIEYWIRMNKVSEGLNQKKAQLDIMKDNYRKIIEEAIESELDCALKTTFYRDLESRELSSEMEEKGGMGFIKQPK